jgi:hypothetical protein
MVITRADAKEAFDHVLDVVLNRPDGSYLKSSLINDGINDIFALVTLTDSIIDSLTYEDPDPTKKGTIYPLKHGDKNLIRCFLHYIIHRNNINLPIGENWKHITNDDFNQFRIDPNFMANFSASPATVTKPSQGSPSPSVSIYSPADLFRRGIKRDPSLFPTLKDERFNDQWHRSFVNQARAQDVSDVLDANYKPSTQNDKDLFVEKQKYVYAILETKVLTDKGKSIVRGYETTFDAQKAYKDLVDHHLKSTKAMIDSASILSYITSSKLGTGEWTGTTESYIINWQNQVRLYERQVPLSDHFSDLQKRIMLQNAVHGIDELRQVKNTAELIKVNSGKDITYDQYVDLLTSAAAAYDNQFKSMRNKRQVFQHDFGTDDEETHDDMDQYDIDTSIDVIQAFASSSDSGF